MRVKTTSPAQFAGEQPEKTQVWPAVSPLCLRKMRPTSSSVRKTRRLVALGAAFEAAQAAGAVIRDDERRALELWLLGERSEVGGPGPSWLREVVSPGQRNWEGPSRAAPYLHRLHCGEDTEVDDIDVASLLPIAFANSRRAGR